MLYDIKNLFKNLIQIFKLQFYCPSVKSNRENCLAILRFPATIAWAFAVDCLILILLKVRNDRAFEKDRSVAQEVHNIPRKSMATNAR